MGNDQPVLRALFACESGLSEPEIGLEHAFALLIWQKKHDKWQNSRCSRCAKKKQTALIDHLRNRLNFDLNKSRQKFHHSLKEHHKISNIPKFRCEML
jgi:hypothetical protein